MEQNTKRAFSLMVIAPILIVSAFITKERREHVLENNFSSEKYFLIQAANNTPASLIITQVVAGAILIPRF